MASIPTDYGPGASYSLSSVFHFPISLWEGNTSLVPLLGHRDGMGSSCSAKSWFSPFLIL